MTDEKNREEVAEKREKPPRRLRVAKCLHCSNEWRARNGNEKKPSKCPECGTRAVVWRDEYTPDLSMNPEENPITDGITERKTENTTEQNREEPRKTENFEDYEEEEAGFILPDGSGVDWQRLVLTHLEERKHRGVLTSSGLIRCLSISDFFVSSSVLCIL